MSQLGETVAVAVFEDDWECPFSHDDEESETVKNLLSSNGQTLGTSMNVGKSTSVQKPKTGEDPRPSWHHDAQIDISGDDYEVKVKVAAHHLIPGEAALPKSDLMEFIAADRGFIESDIGYNVNGRQNGIWLPGNYGVSGWGDLTIKGKTSLVKIKNDQLQAAYAYAAMDKARAQFHDAHGAYSDFVIKVLNKIHIKALMGSIAWCEECKKEEDKLPPPYGLVKRLDGLSSRLASFLRYPSTKWKPPVFTSIWALRLKANDALAGKN